MSGAWLETPEWLLMPAAPGHAGPLARLHARNGSYFDKGMSVVPEMAQPGYWEEILQRQQGDMNQGAAVHLVGFAKGMQGVEAGCVIGFAGIVLEDFRACSLGYRIDRSLEGRSLMHAAVAPAIAAMFERFQLNRIMATHQPDNLRSARLLRRLGFVVEGYARDFILINGQWRDQVLLSLLASSRPAAAVPPAQAKSAAATVSA